MKQPAEVARKTRWAKNIWIFGIVFAVSFVVLIWALGPNLKHFTDTFIQRNDISWYYWKLPERNSWGMNIIWIMYLANQISIWAITYFAQKNRYGFRNKSPGGLLKYTVFALLITVTFVFLHLIQTQVWFDGLAQDVPILTSQGSVIVLLSIVLIIENQRRGLFLGRKAGKPFTANVAAFFRSSHKYIFAWAPIYTFWFHPWRLTPNCYQASLHVPALYTTSTSMDSFTTR